MSKDLKKVFRLECEDRWGSTNYHKTHFFHGTREAAEARIARLIEEGNREAVDEHQRDIDWHAKRIDDMNNMIAFFETLTPEQQALFSVVDTTLERLKESLDYTVQGYKELIASTPTNGETWKIEDTEHELVEE